jgi:hypothetical protein
MKIKGTIHKTYRESESDEQYGNPKIDGLSLVPFNRFPKTIILIDKMTIDNINFCSHNNDIEEGIGSFSRIKELFMESEDSFFRFSDTVFDENKEMVIGLSLLALSPFDEDINLPSNVIFPFFERSNLDWIIVSKLVSFNSFLDSIDKGFDTLSCRISISEDLFSMIG